MNIHCILVVKNEADIVELTLQRATSWASRIYVFDTGSTDDTWARVLRMAEGNAVIVPYKQEIRPFNDQLRAEVFRAFRHEADRDSWWCRLDADENYPEDPRIFLTGVPPHHHVVWMAHVQYYFTEQDVARFPDVNSAPVIDETNRPRFYSTNWSEPRFFRHRDRLRWDYGAWPRHVGIVHPRRIPVRHFQYRSPRQIQQRLDTRREATAAGCDYFKTSLQAHWQQQVRDSKSLCYDDGSRPLVINERMMPRHLEPFWLRAVKHVMHGLRLWP